MIRRLGFLACVGTVAVLAQDIDLCPDDPNKDAPGACGCGTPDDDFDGDGTPDCNVSWMFFDEYYRWEDAEAFCNALGGHLPAFYGQSQLNRFVEYMESVRDYPWSDHEGVWLGGNDIGAEGNFSWVSTSDVFWTEADGNLIFSKWNEDQPNNLDSYHEDPYFTPDPSYPSDPANCIVMKTNDYSSTSEPGWNDIGCADHSYFACQFIELPQPTDGQFCTAIREDLGADSCTEVSDATGVGFKLDADTSECHWLQYQHYSFSHFNGGPGNLTPINVCMLALYGPKPLYEAFPRYPTHDSFYTRQEHQQLVPGWNSRCYAHENRPWCLEHDLLAPGYDWTGASELRPVSMEGIRRAVSLTCYMEPGDLCPGDPNKDAPGACGCGVADDDSDGDGIADCNDECPEDRNKDAPGACGCDSPDDDFDGDGIADCNVSWMFFNEYYRWEDAQTFCNALGGHLPALYGQSQLDRFVEYMESVRRSPWTDHEGVWLSGNDIAVEGTFSWGNSSDVFWSEEHGNQIFSAWNENQPNNLDSENDDPDPLYPPIFAPEPANCIVMKRDTFPGSSSSEPGWSDISCTDHTYFACQFIEEPPRPADGKFCTALREDLGADSCTEVSDATGVGFKLDADTSECHWLQYHHYSFSHFHDGPGNLTPINVCMLALYGPQPLYEAFPRYPTYDSFYTRQEHQQLVPGWNSRCYAHDNRPWCLDRDLLAPGYDWTDASELRPVSTEGIRRAVSLTCYIAQDDELPQP